MKAGGRGGCDDVEKIIYNNDVKICHLKTAKTNTM